MKRRRRLSKHDKPVVWRDEDKDWLWQCRGCYRVGIVEHDMQSAFAGAFRHATTHVMIGFQAAA